MKKYLNKELGLMLALIFLAAIVTYTICQFCIHPNYSF